MGFHYRIYNNRRPHFITISVINRIALFKKEEHKSCVIGSLEFCQRMKGLKLHAWCLMPDTLYLLCQAKEGKELSGIIRDFKNYTSKRIVEQIKEFPDLESEILLKQFKKAGVKNRKNIEYKVWEDGYYPDELYSRNYIIKKLEYIHVAPVEHNIVARSLDYNYSSAKNYNDQVGMLEIIKIEL